MAGQAHDLLIDRGGLRQTVRHHDLAAADGDDLPLHKGLCIDALVPGAQSGSRLTRSAARHLADRYAALPAMPRPGTGARTANARIIAFKIRAPKK